MKTWFCLALILIATWLGFGWALMLEIGVAHRDWWPLLPLMSYHVALIFSFIAILFGLVVSIAKVAVEKS